MAITFPTTLDALTNPISTNPLNNPSQSAQHANENDAIEALEAKVGIDSSAVTTSHDYKLSLIATGQKVVGNDGWISANETWTYASASTITVPSGAASKYQKGDRIKWTQSTVKYGVITVVADTLLTIAVNTDYVVTNAAISANFYSHQINPMGFPDWFTFTPYLSGTGGSAGTFAQTVSFAKFSIKGMACTVELDVLITNVGSWSADFLFTLPIAPTRTTNWYNLFVQAKSGIPFLAAKATFGGYSGSLIAGFTAFKATTFGWAAVAVNDSVFGVFTYDI